MSKIKEKSKIEEFMLPTNDYVFKRIFGHKGNESITKDIYILRKVNHDSGEFP